MLLGKLILIWNDQLESAVTLTHSDLHGNIHILTCVHIPTHRIKFRINCVLEYKLILSLQTFEQLIPFCKTHLHTRNIRMIEIKTENCF